MTVPLRLLLCGLLGLGGVAAGFLVSNSESGGRFVFQAIPASRRPAEFQVDTQPVPGVADPLAVTAELMGQWSGIPGAPPLFASPRAGDAYDGTNVGTAFGNFGDGRFEVAWDGDGEILQSFGVGGTVLGITLKSLVASTGELRDLLVVINTRPGALSAPGTSATAEELFRGTLLHELGHALGLGHSMTGMVNQNSFGFDLLAASQMPTMHPFRFPGQPQEGGTIEDDDRAAVLFAYGAQRADLGGIAGRVRAASGAPVDEIAIRAVGPSPGDQRHVGRLTDTDGRGEGNFEIPHLAPGRYRVIVEAVNGRASVDGAVLASGDGSLGADPFLFAGDEYWEPGDTWDPARDDPASFVEVTVRAGRVTGGVDFVLNGARLVAGGNVDGRLGSGDAQIPESNGSFHFADYYLFEGAAGETVSITASSFFFRPQLRLLRPGDLEVEEFDLPVDGTSARIDTTLDQGGTYTLVLSAAASTGNPGGTGTYDLALSGATGTVPADPLPVPASVVAGPASPVARQFASPVCDVPMLQVRCRAPSHEEFWIDRLTVRLSGSADDGADGTTVGVVVDLDGDGERDAGEPLLASRAAGADDAVLVLDALDLVIAPGESRDLLLVLDARVTSVATPDTAAAAWLLLPLVFLGFAVPRRRRLGIAVVLLLTLPCSLPGCGGGGGGAGGCNGPFDPAGASVDFRVRIDAADLEAATSTSDPAVPLLFPEAAFDSPLLEVSN